MVLSASLKEIAMKKLFLVVAVGCLFSAATSAAFGEGRQGPPHWPAPRQTQLQQAGAAGQIGPLILRYRPQILGGDVHPGKGLQAFSTGSPISEEPGDLPDTGQKPRTH